MMKGDIQIGRVRIKLFDLDKGSTAEILSDYSGNVRDLMRQYNKAAYSELQKIGDELKQKLKLEIGVYINGKNKVATKKFFNSIYRRVNIDTNNRVVLQVGSKHPWIGSILRGQGKVGLAPDKEIQYPPGGFSALEQNMKTWISKKHIAFYYWYEGPKVGRKLKRMDKSRTLFLLMRSIGKTPGWEKFHQGVLPSNRMYQKTSLPTITRSNGNVTSTRRPSKREYYHHRSGQIMLKHTFDSMIPEIRERINKVKESFGDKISLPK